MRNRKNSKKKVKRKKIKVKWAIILIIILAAFFYIYNLSKPKAPSYESVDAKTGDITKYYSFSGNVESKNYQTIKAEKIMQISQILVENGDEVKKDDVLIKTSSNDEIKAPIDGKITGLDLSINDQILTGSRLLDIYDYKNLRVNVKVNEYDLSSLDIGKEVKININSLNKELDGTISSISDIGTTINDVSYFTAVIDLENDNTIKIGMSCEIKLINAQAKSVIILPMASIYFNDDNTPYVLLKDEKNKPIKTKITTGINDGINIEIKSGISNGQTILYSKNNSANQGI
ncbi:MAG: HlyD family efflux transporter periplasmic adaptor subunit [Oscillospiraceae bacterium]|nr:HlyD family efflux transporter periplasmic adaptor subunit [Oscillospiraceae bacterium]